MAQRAAAACVTGATGFGLLSYLRDGSALVRAQSIVLNPAPKRDETCREASSQPIAWRESLSEYFSTAVPMPLSDQEQAATETGTDTISGQEYKDVFSVKSGKEYKDVSSVKCPYSAAMYVGTKLSTKCPAWVNYKDAPEAPATIGCPELDVDANLSPCIPAPERGARMRALSVSPDPTANRRQRTLTKEEKEELLAKTRASLMARQGSH
jgi:hypothetical protein